MLQHVCVSGSYTTIRPCPVLNYLPGRVADWNGAETGGGRNRDRRWRSAGNWVLATMALAMCLLWRVDDLHGEGTRRATRPSNSSREMKTLLLWPRICEICRIVEQFFYSSSQFLSLLHELWTALSWCNVESHTPLKDLHEEISSFRANMFLWQAWIANNIPCSLNRQKYSGWEHRVQSKCEMTECQACHPRPMSRGQSFFDEFLCIQAYLSHFEPQFIETNHSWVLN